MENEQVTTQSPIESAALDYLVSDDAVSSQQQNVNDILQRAGEVRNTGIQAAQAGLEASTNAAEGTFGVEMNRLQGNIQEARRAFAQGSNFGTSTAQFKTLNDTIQTNLNELRVRKQEALESANADYLAQVNAMELQYLETQQQATQQMFQNMLGIAGIQQEQQSFRLQERQQAFTERAAINEVALEFGLQADANESLDSIVAKAAPIVQEMRGLEKQEAELRLEQIKESIATQKAQRAEINRRRNDERELAAYVNGLSAEDKKVLIRSGDLDGEILRKAGDIEGLKELVGIQRGFQMQEASKEISDMLDDNADPQTIKDTVMKLHPTVSEAEIDLMLASTEEVTGSKGYVAEGIDVVRESGAIKATAVEAAIGSAINNIPGASLIPNRFSIDLFDKGSDFIKNL